VPIKLRGVAYGNLYVTEKAGEEGTFGAPGTPLSSSARRRTSTSSWSARSRTSAAGARAASGIARRFGLAAALERLAENARQRSELVVELQVRLPQRLVDEIETTVYRVVQEALTNVARHAEAPSASVVVVHQGPVLSVVVEDDGRGFDVNGSTNRFGLVSMRERVAIVRGTLDVDSQPGRGTTLRARIPIP
jgi:anti-sigma regulatory factor (Ser/Thr protein kinase)